MSHVPSPDAEPPTLKERIDTAVAVVYGQRGYTFDGGSPNINAVADALLPEIIKAEAHSKGERAKVCLTRRALVEIAFPGTVGPEGWSEEDDPELAQGVYGALDTDCYRLTQMQPTGQIQKRLDANNGTLGLVLCRTNVNPNKTQAIYVTRDLGCLLEDAIKPQREGQKKRADRDAAFTAMLIERVPEHGKRFHRDLVNGLRTGLQSAESISAIALEATTTTPDDDDAAEGDDDAAE